MPISAICAILSIIAMETLTDEQLIVNYRNGDESALEVLIQRYFKQIYGFVYHYAGQAAEAEDLTQETFVRVWKNLKKFDTSRSFKAWVFTIAKNISLDYLKKKKSLPISQLLAVEEENKFLESLVDVAPLPDQLAAATELKGYLSSKVDRLSVKYRQVVKDHVEGELTFQEIAENLGEPLNTVKSRYRRALAALKEMLS